MGIVPYRFGQQLRDYLRSVLVGWIIYITIRTGSSRDFN